MSSISYVQAGASCLPIIGPFIALYNMLDVLDEGALDSFSAAVTKAQASIILTQGTFAAHKKDLGGVNKAIQEVEKLNTEMQNKYLPISEKASVYAICGIAGNILSIAAMITLVAFGILGSAASAICCACFAFQAVCWGYSFYQCNQAIEALQPA